MNKICFSEKKVVLLHPILDPSVMFAFCSRRKKRMLMACERVACLQAYDPFVCQTRRLL